MINTFAIVATDFCGYISHKGLPVGVHAKNPSVSSLDFAALREAVKQVVDGSENPMLVIGTNTFAEIQGTVLFETHLQPNFNHICQVGREGLFKDGAFVAFQEQGTLTEARRRIFTYALNMGCDSILVLGGESVYKTFENHYSYIHHTLIKDYIGGEGDKRWNVPNIYKTELVLYDDADLRIQILADTGEAQ